MHHQIAAHAGAVFFPTAPAHEAGCVDRYLRRVVQPLIPSIVCGVKSTGGGITTRRWDCCAETQLYHLHVADGAVRYSSAPWPEQGTEPAASRSGRCDCSCAPLPHLEPSPAVCDMASRSRVLPACRHHHHAPVPMIGTRRRCNRCPCAPTALIARVTGRLGLSGSRGRGTWRAVQSRPRRRTRRRERNGIGSRLEPCMPMPISRSAHGRWPARARSAAAVLVE